MKRIPRLQFALLLLLGPATAQLPVAYRDDVFTNTTGQGTPGLKCRVFYPATAAGIGTPLLPAPGGYPVVLHLHGQGGNGIATPDYATAVATTGYIMVMQDTASTSSSTQYNDALATIIALQAENTKPSSFYVGQLDMTRFAVIGHSMGGGNTFRVLAVSTVPKVGVAFAPTNQTSTAPNVKVPMLLINGLGDTVLSPTSSVNNYNALTNYTGTKTLFQFNTDCGHGTMLAWPQTPTELAIFTRSMRVTVGFLDTWLKARPRGFEDVAGLTARSEPRLNQLLQACERPVMWSTFPSASPLVARVSFVTEPGSSFLMAAVQTASVPTPFGVLGLDPSTIVVVPTTTPSTKLVNVDFTVPPALVLNGFSVPFQSLGATRVATQPKLSNVSSVAYP
jgi:pimeloyl-ACP methyl ester carboxylesterase